MSYEVNGSCPDDELLAQKLLLKGCEPLPRCRCHPAAPLEYVEPYTIPESFWSTPSDSSVVWTAYTCKNYLCLINRKRDQRGFDDCKDSFDLGGREKTRWTESNNRGGIDFGIDEVLEVKKNGTIRIGLDIGGGAATFAVRKREKNITIITTSMNLNGPFNSFIASRGVVPMVLRPGGLFWLDHFFCVGEQLEDVYTPLLESIGFNKVKWVVGKKLDRAPELREMYLSALLEKPLTNSL
ncbi:S-adenosyl-L-methionine-dependent methyltransferase [Artemisia annua]|uniref:S-adenosyl-L-methionine-dependent methyltransferase n=1 Tax=Artemisia annua TaxID=35608 RepID=A0A2U1N1K0_ARTAN|nr:S-adenosyl-L-methionine-dependent methyltransferase [Artemisia annua]